MGVLVESVTRYAPKRFQQNFYGEDNGAGVTSVNLMGANTVVGIPVPTAIKTRNVAVRFRRSAGTAPGDWTLRLFKNGSQVATFSVGTT